VATTVSDVDRDGRPDLITAQGGHDAEVYLRRGAGWQKRESELVPTSLRSLRGVFAADFDDDGALDLLTTPHGSGFVGYPDGLPPHEVHLLRGTAAGGFERAQEGSMALEHTALNVANHAVADFDNDGRLDIFEVGWSIPADAPPGAPDRDRNGTTDAVATIRVHYGASVEGDEHITFVRQDVVVSGEEARFDQENIGGEMVCGDFDLDGHVDVAFVAKLAIHMFFGTDDRGRFRHGLTGFRTDVGVLGLLAGDLERDGDLDLVGGEPNGVGILENRRDASRFLEVWLRGGEENPEAIGATVWLMPAGRGGDRSVRPLGRRDVMSTSRQPSPTMVHFGLAGEDATFDLEIRWPGERERTVVHRVREGARIVVRRPE
jgi:hypothetical protein